MPDIAELCIATQCMRKTLLLPYMPRNTEEHQCTLFCQAQSQAHYSLIYCHQGRDAFLGACASNQIPACCKAHFTALQEIPVKCQIPMTNRRAGREADSKKSEYLQECSVTPCWQPDKASCKPTWLCNREILHAKKKIPPRPFACTQFLLPWLCEVAQGSLFICQQFAARARR